MADIKLTNALQVHRPRVQLAAAMETGCTTKARALANYVLNQAAERLGAARLKKGTSQYLLRQVRVTASTLRAQGVLA